MNDLHQISTSSETGSATETATRGNGGDTTCFVGLAVNISINEGLREHFCNGTAVAELQLGVLCLEANDPPRVSSSRITF